MMDRAIIDPTGTDTSWQVGFVVSDDETLQEFDIRFYVDLLTHDIKNLNQGACGYLELMTMMSDTTDKQRRFLEEAISYVRMSSDLISSIETEANTSDPVQQISTDSILTDSICRLRSLNGAVDIDVRTSGFDISHDVKGNLLWIDHFTYLMDFIVKRARDDPVVIEISKVAEGNGSVLVSIKGNMQEIQGDDAKYLFTKGHGSDSGRGKLILCRSIAERFGGKVKYLPQSVSSKDTGEFLITLREVND